MRTKTICLFCALFLVPAVYAGNDGKERKYTLNGHLQDLQMEWIEDFRGSWQDLNTISNRFDFRWFPKTWFSTHIGMRNILEYGQLVEYSNILSGFSQGEISSLHDLMTKDPGYFQLTYSLADERSFFAYTNFDRANIQITRNKLSFTLGRQRINWSSNLVWTPNDIFNTFNYYDFDYVERPGCDAALVQYYTGSTSSLQAAVKIDHEEEITVGAMYKFLFRNYDFQFMAGKMEDDAVLGAGWSGQAWGAGFNGELSYFRDLEKFSDTSGQLVASVGANYTLNRWYFHMAGLLNTDGTTGPASMGNFIEFNRNISAKTLTLARYSVFGEISYQITPLILADASAIYNPNDKSIYLGPSVDFSLTDNIGLLVTGQIFLGSEGTEFGDYGTMLYLRLKWSF